MNDPSTPPGRDSPIPASPSSNSLHKLPKFLHRHHPSRDRTVSFGGGYSPASSSESISPPPRSKTLTRKSSRLFGKERNEPRQSNSSKSSHEQSEDGADEVGSLSLVGPSSSAQERGALVHHSRSRVNRPLSISHMEFPSRLQVHGSPSAARIADLSGRVSGWLQHAFSSTTDLTLPPASPATSTTSLSQSLPSSSTSPKTPTRKSVASAASIMAHLPGKANLERAVRYLLDSDIAQPEKSTEPIWLMGIEHPPYDPPATIAPSSPITDRPLDTSNTSLVASPNRNSVAIAPSRSLSHHPNLSSQSVHTVALSQPRDSGWPSAFYEDFTSCIWLTYRSHYPTAIRDETLQGLEPPSIPTSFTFPHALRPPASPTPSVPPPSPPPKTRWGWGGEKTWNSDTGWGCMLRTGQSVLANALLHLHLSRDWRTPSSPVQTAEYATYVQILTWFFDTPSPAAPFSIHRMALAGKDLGKDVGCWFGPSTAAGAIKTLTRAFPMAGLSTVLAADGVLYESDVYAASQVTISGLHSHHSSLSPSVASTYSKRSKNNKAGRRKWGDRAVLVLIATRLGINGVNPVYYDHIKALFRLPQSVGIAGGRPSSSYYFIGYQGDHLFYLDPHHTRPAVPLQTPPDPSVASTLPTPSNIPASPMTPDHKAKSKSSKSAKKAKSKSSDSPDTLGSSQQPSPLPSPSPSPIPLDPLQSFYVNAYSPADLATFHCDRVRKMPMSGLDPSMLLAFLCKDEKDWKDFRERIGELGRSHAIFTIGDEPPSWGEDSDDDVGMESVSEPDSDLHSIVGGTSVEDDGSGEGPLASQSTDSILSQFEDLQVVTPGPIPSASYGPAVPSPPMAPMSGGEDSDSWVVDPSPGPSSIRLVEREPDELSKPLKASLRNTTQNHRRRESQGVLLEGIAEGESYVGSEDASPSSSGLMTPRPNVSTFEASFTSPPPFRHHKATAGPASSLLEQFPFPSSATSRTSKEVSPPPPPPVVEHRHRRTESVSRPVEPQPRGSSDGNVNGNGNGNGDGNGDGNGGGKKSKNSRRTSRVM